TDDQEYLRRYQGWLQTTAATQARLTTLTADNPIQQERLRVIRGLADRRIAQFQTVIELRQAQGFEGAQREIMKGGGKHALDQIRSAIEQMRATEQALLAQRQRKTDRSTTLTQSITWGGGGLAFAFVGMAGLAIRRDFAGRERAERALRQAKDELE